MSKFWSFTPCQVYEVEREILKRYKNNYDRKIQLFLDDLRAGAGEMLQHFNLFRKFDRSLAGPICHLSREQKISLHLLPEFLKK